MAHSPNLTDPVCGCILGITCSRCTPGASAIADRLRMFATLAPGWDSYGADPIDPAVLASAERDAAAWGALGLRHVYPTPHGGVQFEGEIGGVACEAEYVGPDAVDMMILDEPDAPVLSVTDAMARLRARAATGAA